MKKRTKKIKEDRIALREALVAQTSRRESALLSAVITLLPPRSIFRGRRASVIGIRNMSFYERDADFGKVGVR